ncbi:hypothetical protein C1645_820651 [Glomus cerebriforme]|uniref:Uncharacterized protein n=1 Tax=Glomus cerebriforme TaxID=658196 RepID=A0A397T5B3_9GLOM|nr:hypothetical protein C1645_820651 [Glomus cerebriforme]
MHTSTISDQTDCTGTTPALRYDDVSPLAGVPSCNEIIAEYDNGMTAILQQSLSGKQPIHFMSTEVSDDTKYINGVSTYILCITGSLINGQKAVVNITAVCAVRMCTASDDLNCQYYYHKVVREERLSLSSWIVLSNYLYEHIQKGTYLFQVSVNNYNPISEDDYNNPLFSLALLRNRTFILTWDIETYNLLGLGNFSTAQSDESSAKKSSLAYYLKECELDNKLDMPFHHMFKYYGRVLKETNATTAKQMREVAEYCIINAISYQWLMIKHNAINEYREMASVAFISLYDSHYFAIGIKVRNFLSAGAWQEGILTSTIPCEQTEIGKYPGAYVFLLVKDVLAWSIEHENQAKMKGLYPKVLEELLIRRNSVKRHLAPLKDKKEELEKEISLVEARREDVTDALKSKYFSVFFNVTCLDAEQLALKVYMNTFYGKAGNSRSSFFLRALAGGVTSTNQHTREEVDAKRCIKKGLTPEPYLYEILKPGECFEYIVVENDSSQRVGDKMEFSEVVRYQPSSEIMLEALKKLKDDNKAGDNKADNDRVDEDDLDEDEEDEDEMDEDEISKIRDALA